MDNHIKLTEEFKLAYRFITETNLNTFLTGNAGTGKTTFLKYLRQNSFKKMLVAAPTGVAAINAGGVTLHSLFHLPFTPFIPGKEVVEGAINSNALLSKLNYRGEKLSLLRNLELLVIDEASMVPGHTVDAVDTILKSVRRKHYQAFGGVQVLFIGDLHQLQPVVKNEEWQFLKEYYPSIFFFDSTILRQHVPVMVELKEIFRQKDTAFIDILNEVRNNNLSRKNFDLLHTRLNPDFIPDEDDGYITLTTHNYQSDKINKGKMQRLEAPARFFKAEIAGDYPEQLYPADANLELKEGAQVMFLKNDLEDKKYFNGKIGIITKLNADLIKVKCKGDADEIEVKKHEWKNINYRLNKDTREITAHELGSFKQYPLRLAWAITIHKSQGLTFDKLVIDSANAFANGQVYVALSRCTSLEGLILTTPINQQFLGAHQNLEDWKHKQDENNLPGKLDESRRMYVQQELLNIFSWNNWIAELRELNELLNEYIAYLPESSLDWINELIAKQKALNETAEKFKERINVFCKENSIVEENESLQKRLKEAALYFSDHLEKWKTNFREHSITTDTKKAAKQLDDMLETVNATTHEILHQVSFCKNGFTLDDYLKHGKKFTGIEKIQSIYAQNREVTIVENEVVHEQLYQRIAAMRKRIAIDADLTYYLIFSNKAIKGVCESLPASKELLLKVKGFGKAKVAQYGDELINLVNEYCSEKNIETGFRISSSSRIKEKSEKKLAEGNSGTIEKTVSLFKAGKTVKEISEERNFRERTIEDHLAEGIERRLIAIEEVMTLDEAKRIADYFPADLEGVRLAAIKEKAPADVTYTAIKMVLGWLRSNRNP